MLGLLLMAGLGFAASAIMEHIDEPPVDEDHPQDQDDHDQVAHGSLLENPADDHAQTQSVADDHAAQNHQDNAAWHDTAPADHDAAITPDAHHQAGPPHTGHQQTGHHPAADHQTAHHPAAHHTAPQTGQDQPTAPNARAVQTPQKLFGTESNDTLHGSANNDLIAGNGGDDRLFGHAGNDHLVAFDQGKDTLLGNDGDDTLHGFLVQHEPGNLSFAVEDHQADRLQGGTGNDSLYLASDDVGSGGPGADQFHVSWDVEHGHPALITDYNPAQDKIYVEFTSLHADADMTHITPEEMTVTTQALKDGSGTDIMINGNSIAHVLGAMYLQPSDIGLIHA